MTSSRQVRKEFRRAAAEAGDDALERVKRLCVR
jgi:hypothetical protein